MSKPPETFPRAMPLVAEQLARLKALSDKMSAYIASVPPGTPGTTAVPEYAEAWLEESKRRRATVQGWVDRYQACLAEIAARLTSSASSNHLTEATRPQSLTRSTSVCKPKFRYRIGPALPSSTPIVR